MRKIKYPIYTDESVTDMFGYAPSLAPAMYAVAVAYAPGENASFWVIVQKFAQALRGKIGLSHDAVLSLIGQRPAGAINAARASLFSRMFAPGANYAN